MDKAVKMFHAGANIERSFTCEEFALMDSIPPDGWEVISNTCSFYLKDFHSPFASFTPQFTTEGVVGLGLIPYEWHGVVSGNMATVPVSELVLATTEIRNHAYVNRQRYYASKPGVTKDFYVNNVDNRLEFETGPGRPNLNGLKITIIVWK